MYIPGFIKKSPEEALSFLLHNDLSKEQYCNMKQACTEGGVNLWPNYNKIVAAKSSCRPNGIIFQELAAEVSLQDLLNHTATRILENVSITYNVFLIPTVYASQESAKPEKGAWNLPMMYLE